MIVYSVNASTIFFSPSSYYQLKFPYIGRNRTGTDAVRCEIMIILEFQNRFFAAPFPIFWKSRISEYLTQNKHINYLTTLDNKVESICDYDYTV
jgi:hypothetical protein